VRRAPGMKGIGQHQPGSGEGESLNGVTYNYDAGRGRWKARIQIAGHERYIGR
jgi:hypothetical protein